MLLENSNSIKSNVCFGPGCRTPVVQPTMVPCLPQILRVNIQTYSRTPKQKTVLIKKTKSKGGCYGIFYSIQDYTISVPDNVMQRNFKDEEDRPFFEHPDSVPVKFRWNIKGEESFL